MIYPAYKWGGGYSKSEVDTLLNDYIPKSGGTVLSGQVYARNVDDESLLLIGGTAYNLGAYLELYGKNNSAKAGQITMACRKSDGTAIQFILQPNGNAVWNGKNLAMYEDVVPRSGGNIMTGNHLGRTVNNDEFSIGGSDGWTNGSTIVLTGKALPDNASLIRMHCHTSSKEKDMYLKPSGTWTWTGQAVQITSDQRLKQQISNIDDKLLDAWEDVELSQFKYNDAVNEKGNQARLHTGYVVQQINEACQNHNIDISAYGLYCHEEYPERTEEVEVTQDDGSIKKETKVIEEASEHYSLRYTETLVVECAYLRRENAKLKEQLQSHEDYLKLVEEHLHLKNL